MTTVTMLKREKYTNRELGDLLGGLRSVEELKGVKFALKVTKNIAILNKELEDIEKAAAPTPEFMQLAQEVQLLEKEGKIEEIKQVEKEGDNPKLIEERKVQIEEFNSLMDEEAEIFLYKISERHLPTDITAKQLGSIQLILKEE
tara:strand:+ start:2296 stop:2730 length:435 start_codon:yes stop_codon:yes gene_type:complete